MNIMNIYDRNNFYLHFFLLSVIFYPLPFNNIPMVSTRLHYDIILIQTILQIITVDGCLGHFLRSVFFYLWSCSTFSTFGLSTFGHSTFGLFLPSVILRSVILRSVLLGSVTVLKKHVAGMSWHVVAVSRHVVGVSRHVAGMSRHVAGVSRDVAGV
jgi:hypothetical protein